VLYQDSLMIRKNGGSFLSKRCIRLILGLSGRNTAGIAASLSVHRTVGGAFYARRQVGL